MCVLQLREKIYLLCSKLTIPIFSEFIHNTNNISNATMSPVTKKFLEYSRFNITLLIIMQE